VNTVYEVHNQFTGVTMRCTKNFLPQWLSRGFEIIQIYRNIPDSRLGKILEGGNIDEYNHQQSRLH
jgi:hypothetical protein